LRPIEDSRLLLVPSVLQEFEKETERNARSVIGMSLTVEQPRAFCAFAKIREQFTRSLLAPWRAAGYLGREFAIRSSTSA